MTIDLSLNYYHKLTLEIVRIYQMCIPPFVSFSEARKPFINLSGQYKYLYIYKKSQKPYTKVDKESFHEKMQEKTLLILISFKEHKITSKIFSFATNRFLQSVTYRLYVIIKI